MAQLVRMDARLDAFSDELCQVNTHVSRIARQQALMGGFTAFFFSISISFRDESDDGSGSDGADGASSSGDEEMTASQ